MTAVAGAPRTVRPAPLLRGRLHIPSDKSIAHRALMANAMADGHATVRIRQPGADVLSTVACLRALGASVTDDGRITGGQLRQPASVLDCGNSGTTMRLLAGALAGRPLTATLDGDASLRGRPMERVAWPLRAMGADVETIVGRPPIRIAGRAPLKALEHRLPVASAQLIGSISLAALAADGTTSIVSPGPTRDHTERLLTWMGVAIRREERTTIIDGPAQLTARSLTVPGDISAASAWLVAASLHPDAALELLDVGLNPTRLAIVEALREMGAQITVTERHHDGPEPSGDIAVRSSEGLRAIHVGGGRVSELIDELPLLAVAMAGADGSSEVRDAAELRVKESDRISATVAGLAAIGAHVEELPDGWRVSRGAPADAAIATHGDHRIAIAFAVAALAGVAGAVQLDDPACTSVSYPSFWDDLATVAV